MSGSDKISLSDLTEEETTLIFNIRVGNLLISRDSFSATLTIRANTATAVIGTSIPDFAPYKVDEINKINTVEKNEKNERLKKGNIKDIVSWFLSDSPSNVIKELDFRNFLIKNGYSEYEARRIFFLVKKFIGFNPDKWPEIISEDLNASATSSSGEHSLPLPTHEELEAGGRLYSQCYGRGGERQGHGSADGSDLSIEQGSPPIIRHLKEVWMPWIKAGVLTRPLLLKADSSAYHALARWSQKDGNDLKTALGYEIPSKSELVDRLAERFPDKRDRPASLEAALRKRAAKGQPDR